MNQGVIGWILSAVAVLGLAASALIFGVNLLPSTEVMQSKLGTLAPLYFTWGMIWATVVMAVALAIFMIATGLGKVRAGK